MPREETFLVSSFLLNFRQAASHTLDMLEHSRVLVERRRERRGRRRIYAPHINWQKWLYTGGGEDERLPANGMQAARRGTADDHDDEQDTDTLSSQKSVLGAPKEGDIEQGISRNDTVDEVSQEHERAKTEKLKSMDSTAEKPALILRFRGSLADAVEWIQNSEDALYAFKLTVAVFLVTWPAFVASWNTWYSLNRGRKWILPSNCSYIME